MLSAYSRHPNTYSLYKLKNLLGEKYIIQNTNKTKTYIQLFFTAAKIKKKYWHLTDLKLKAIELNECWLLFLAVKYRVRPKKWTPKFFTVFSATVLNFNLKFYRFIYQNLLHLTAK